MTTFIRAPMVNLNSEVMRLVVWTRTAGTRVGKGEIIGLLETSKSTFDLQVEDEGFLYFRVDAGAEIRVGETLAALTEHEDQPIDWPKASPADDKIEAGDGHRRWTKKAELLALRGNIDIEAVTRGEGDGPVTESEIRALMDIRARSTADARDVVDDIYPTGRQERILVAGAGDGASLVLDIIARTPHQRGVAMLDDDPRWHGRARMGVSVVGRLADIERLWKDGSFDAVVCSVSTIIPFRVKVREMCATLGIPMASVIDPTVSVCTNVQIGAGNVILGFARLGPTAVIGRNNFIGAYTNIEHHAVVGDDNTFGPGVMLSGFASIGHRIRFGTGIFIEPKVQIGDDAIVASGAILTMNVPPGSLVRTHSTISIQPRS